jgi:KTSC domain-containing protein
MPPIKNAVESSNILSVTYSPEFQILQVEFKNGKIYDYMALPADIFYEFMAAESKGSYLAKNIKGKFECKEYISATIPAGQPIPEIDEITGDKVNG